jgi:hypothetical protein
MGMDGPFGGLSIAIFSKRIGSKVGTICDCERHRLQSA